MASHTLLTRGLPPAERTITFSPRIFTSNPQVIPLALSKFSQKHSCSELDILKKNGTILIVYGIEIPVREVIMVKSKSEKKTSVPPYISYTTLRNFTDSLRHAPPPNIDRAMMKSMGGTLQTQLLSTLRYLSLMDSDNRVQPIYTRFIKADGADKQKILRNILESAYPFLFDSDSGFDLSTATESRFTQRFREAGAEGGTIRKCQLFFLRAAQEAGIPISPYIQAPQNRSKKGRASRSRASGPPQFTKKSGATQGEDQNLRDRDVDHDTPKVTYDQMLVDKLLSKFPDFDQSWPDEAKTKWHENFKDLMRMVRDATGRKETE